MGFNSAFKGLNIHFYHHAYGAKHHISHRVQLSLLRETHTTRSVKYISFVLRYAAQLQTGAFYSGSHIKKNRMKSDLGLLKQGLPAFQFFRDQTRVEIEGDHFHHQM